MVLDYGVLPCDARTTADQINRTRNTTKQIFAIDAKVPASTPNPSTAAISAKTTNVRVQLNMILVGFTGVRNSH